jgi:hypothetical protein
MTASVAQSKRLKRIEAAVWKLALNKWACVAAFALIPVGLRLALLPWIPPPQPAVQDEFSYLLAGDTFASGRLTNPPHPLWVFFESVHVIQQPSYMSKYPPLSGLMLAFGQRVFGQPWIGILLSLGVLCGAMAWAMQNWLPPFWALIGTTIAVLKIGILSYWTESYWGGTGAAIGGALLIGSLPALIRRPSCFRGIPAAIGVALLANSRPFEGLVLTFFCLGYAGWQIVQRTPIGLNCFRRVGRSVIAPLIIVMVPVGAWMAFYNYRVTGSALLMPYVAHERQYVVTSQFFWESLRAVPTYRHEALRRVWLDWELTRRIYQRKHYLLTRFLYFGWLEQVYLGILVGILIVGCAPALAKGNRTRAAFWLGILFLAVVCVELEFLPHYAAPGTVLFYIAAAGALRRLRHWRPRRPWVSSAVYAGALLGVTLQLTVGLSWPQHGFLFDKRGFQAERARILKFLNGAPGRQLVFVRYGPSHDINSEWVYNRADIDRSVIVWARSMGPEKDQALISYFKDRHVWLLEENGGARISSYAVAGHLAEKVSSAARSAGT